MSENDYGPDHKTTADEPKSASKPGPKPAARRTPLGRLGENRKMRSSIRKLNDEDREKIITFYTFASAGVMPFHRTAAQAMATSAEQCADAWMALAEENDRVRKTILMIVEGSAWGGVIAAHLPILLAVVPASMLPFPMNFGPPEQGEEQAA